MKRRFVRLFFYFISLVIKNIRKHKKFDLYWTLLWLRSGRWMKWHVTSFIFDLLLNPTRGVHYISTTSFSFMFSGKSMSKFGFSMSNFFDFLAEIQSLWNRSCHSSFSFQYATSLVDLLLAVGQGLLKVGSSLVSFVNEFLCNTDLYKLIMAKFKEVYNAEIRCSCHNVRNLQK